jgi:hypothetical protein
MTNRSKRLSHLSAEQLEYLHQQVQVKEGRASPLPFRSQKRGASPVPLSFAQQRLWFLEQLGLEKALYNITTPLRFTQFLDVTVLARSLNEIVRRHEILRTTFMAVEGQPFQVIAPNLVLPLPVVDLRSFPQAEREAEAIRVATEATWSPFDLAQGPLIRALLLRLVVSGCIILV